jgi:hypothetical protein
MAESFFGTLECELLDRRPLRTHAEAKLAVFEFIEGWYNTQRRHSSLGYLSPNESEKRHAEGVPGDRVESRSRLLGHPGEPLSSDSTREGSEREEEEKGDGSGGGSAPEPRITREHQRGQEGPELESAHLSTEAG